LLPDDALVRREYDLHAEVSGQMGNRLAARSFVDDPEAGARQIVDGVVEEAELSGALATRRPGHSVDIPAAPAGRTEGRGRRRRSCLA